jgi:hypothetical protein
MSKANVDINDMCIEIEDKIYKIVHSEGKLKFKEWRDPHWLEGEKMEFDVRSGKVRPVKCPVEHKGGARKRITRRKKSGTKRRHV